MMVKHIAAALLPLLLTGINALPSAPNADYLGTASSTVLFFLTSDDSLHLRSKLSNIHVKWMEPVSHGDLTLSYTTLVQLAWKTTTFFLIDSFGLSQRTPWVGAVFTHISKGPMPSK
jgi:hypothetical protein